jgi:polyhydroxybutyrate depolymerase
MSHHHHLVSCAVLLALGVHCTTTASDPGSGTGGVSPGAAGRAGTGGARTGGITGTAGSGGIIGTGGGVTVGAGGTAGINSTAQTGGITGSGGDQSRADAGADATSPDAEGGAPASCGTRTALRGKTSRTVMVNGASRTFVAYLPQSLKPSTPVPLVYVFHGANQTGENMYQMTDYSTLADRENIAVVFPDGQGTSSATGAGSLAPWHVSDGPALCGLGTLVNNLNAVDFPFLDVIRGEMETDQCIDPAHIFAAGFSMGGYFSHHIACDRPDFRAAAPHSGATMADLSSCKTSRMPIIIFHGLADTLISPGCSDPNASQQAGFSAAATLWAKKNGCQGTYKTVAEMGPTTGKDGNCYLYDGCPADGQVELCTFAGMPHAWAGAATCPGCIGSGAGYASATQLEWDFFKKYAW